MRRGLLNLTFFHARSSKGQAREQIVNKVEARGGFERECPMKNFSRSLLFPVRLYSFKLQGPHKQCHISTPTDKIPRLWSPVCKYTLTSTNAPLPSGSTDYPSRSFLGPASTSCASAVPTLRSHLDIQYIYGLTWEPQAKDSCCSFLFLSTTILRSLVDRKIHVAEPGTYRAGSLKLDVPGSEEVDSHPVDLSIPRPAS